MVDQDLVADGAPVSCECGLTPRCNAPSSTPEVVGLLVVHARPVSVPRDRGPASNHDDVAVGTGDSTTPSPGSCRFGRSLKYSRPTPRRPRRGRPAAPGPRVSWAPHPAVTAGRRATEDYFAGPPGLSASEFGSRSGFGYQDIAVRGRVRGFDVRSRVRRGCTTTVTGRAAARSMGRPRAGGVAARAGAGSVQNSASARAVRHYCPWVDRDRDGAGTLRQRGCRSGYPRREERGMWRS